MVAALLQTCLINLNADPFQLATDGVELFKLFENKGCVLFVGGCEMRINAFNDDQQLPIHVISLTAP